MPTLTCPLGGLTKMSHVSSNYPTCTFAQNFCKGQNFQKYGKLPPPTGGGKSSYHSCGLGERKENDVYVDGKDDDVERKEYVGSKDLQEKKDRK